MPNTSRRNGSHPPAAISPQSEMLLFEVPYSAPTPRLINPEIGLTALVPAADRDGAPQFTIDVTLLDSADHRLLRAGVTLAHRVHDGTGEWYLSSAKWPGLPHELSEPLGGGDLPDGMADLVRPFQRVAPIGPQAALNSEQRRFAFLGDAGEVVAQLLDQKITVRRGGLTTARYREVTIASNGGLQGELSTGGLNSEQRKWLVKTLAGVGASRTSEFPTLVSRLGPPATGLSDFVAPRAFSRDDTLEGFVGNLIATRLHELLLSDLAVRTGGFASNGHKPAARFPSAIAQLLRTELLGLREVMQSEWVAEVSEHLQWLGDTPSDLLPTRLRTRRYLNLLEQLVTAARGPQLTVSGLERARPELARILQGAVEQLSSALARAGASATDDGWHEARGAADHCLSASAVVAHLRPKAAGRVGQQVAPLASLLAEAVDGDRNELLGAQLPPSVTTEAAFELGRRYERQLVKRSAIRAHAFSVGSESLSKLAR